MVDALRDEPGTPAALISPTRQGAVGANPADETGMRHRLYHYGALMPGHGGLDVADGHGFNDGQEWV